ncbi:hypothetical protein L5I01_00780 [Gordonia sp. HY442]|uniref:hypothetical protein n=1 Tax=Gordonia zhenghanii TaxID=2911516 RepID=UPI001F1E6BE8|nr:hypothetical protein [Gordonia zhenghanii]MCF8601886.1 hypothetical protein [Gordonia zhenghanii]
MTLTLAAQVALIAAGVIFLWALLLGVWKFAEITRSSTGHAHVYVDIAHRAALMYSFATAMLAVFAQFSAWSTVVNVVALGVVVFFFVTAVASYCLHGALRDTDNQMHPTSPMMTAAMVALIIGEVGGSAVVIAGFIVEQSHTWS